MVADIARFTYDPTRQYRSLVYQQGRVTLEADNNEAAILAAEALRLETIDIVGPVGALGAGYQVTGGKKPGSLAVNSGVLYLGGWRLERKDPFEFVTPEAHQLVGKYVVAVLATERSVGAVEDTALLEVALGGPDSAARTRLMQSFPLVSTNGDTCAAGLTSVVAQLATEGVTIDAACQLHSSARLQAGFVAGPSSTDPCTPAAAGGYLGADNQMVRVTVTQFNPATNTGTLLWGWNNASLLYRASTTDGLNLKLANMPVDQEHAPQAQQMVEILLTDLDLGEGDVIAAGEGAIAQVAQGYAADTQVFGLAPALPANYQNTTDPVFVRLWQASVAFTGGTAVALDTTSGITVTITMTAAIHTPPPAGQISARPFWHFSVRPAASTNIYPERYGLAPQPPDGPRQWLADLAIVETVDSRGKLIADCRPIVQPITTHSGGCCGLTLGPDDVAGRGGLQAVVDGLAGAPAVLSLKPGAYPLAAPLLLSAKHAGLTIEACGGGVTLSAGGSNMTPFTPGLIVMSGVTGITLRGLDFTAPVVAVQTAAGAQPGPVSQTLSCILIGDANGVVFETCGFTLAATATTALGGGIVVVGATTGVVLKGASFTGSGGGVAVCGLLALVDSNNGATAFDGWTIEDNLFEALAFGAFVFAQLGLVTCRDNVVVNCASGFVVAEANLAVTAAFAYEVTSSTDADRDLTLAPTVNAALRPDILTNVVAMGAPILAALPAPASPPAAVSTVARKALADQLQTSGAAVYKTFTAANAAAAKTVHAKAETAPAKAAAKVDTANYDTLNAIGVTAELLQRDLTPALRIEGNEVALSSAVSTPWLGLGVILDPNEPGSVMISGNRVVVPDATAVACSVFLPASAVVSGNLLVQLAAAKEGSTSLPNLIVIATTSAIAVASNVVTLTPEYVTPARTTAPAAGWDFLNTVI